MMPNASNEASSSLGSDAKLPCDPGDTVASPYLMDRGWNGRCPLVERGWMINPSTAAQIKIFRAIPGIVSLGSAGSANDHRTL